MPSPQSGDMIIRGTIANGFELIEAVTWKHIAGPFEAFKVALITARSKGATAIWQLSVDHRGRVLGDPFCLPSRD